MKTGQLLPLQVAILIVSANYLASDWIIKEELPALLEEQSKRRLRILPLIVTPSLWKATPLAYYQLLPRGGKALSLLPESEQDEVLLQLTEEVMASLRQSDALLRAPTGNLQTTISKRSMLSAKEKKKTKTLSEITEEKRKKIERNIWVFHISLERRR